MSTELRDETVKALKTGVEFLDKVKIKLDSNELKRKLDEVHCIFAELVKKWEGNDKQKVELRGNTKFASPVKKELNDRSSKSFPLRRNDEKITGESKPNKKEKRSLFQQLRSNSKSREDLFEAAGGKKADKKRLSAQDIVHVHLPAKEVREENGYLSLKGPDTSMRMSSDVSKFRKVTKVKLMVNNKAIGSRTCCLQGSNILLGRELDDQVAEYVLGLTEYYRLSNHKSIHFELSKREATYSFRFENETDCEDWYNTIDGIIETQGMYSYVAVQNGLKESSQKRDTPMRHKLETVTSESFESPITPVYEYPEFVAQKPRAKTYFDTIDESSTGYSYTNSLTSSLRCSMPPGWDPTSTEIQHLMAPENSTRNLAGSKDKTPIKPKPKFRRDRSISL